METLREQERQVQPKFSEATRRAFVYAQKYADASNTHIGTLQVLYGVLKEMSIEAAEYVLRQNKIDVKQFNTDFLKILASGKARKPFEETTLTRLAKAVITCAVNHSILQGATDVEPWHVLIGIARYTAEAGSGGSREKAAT